jgi:phage terminase small subunit
MSEVPDGLTPSIYEFALIWLANGYNGAAAYKASHPDCQSEAAARAGGARLLANANVRAYLRTQLESRWAEHEMSADEAAARVAMDARSDPRLLFNAKGELLPPHEWPDEIANSIESVDMTTGKVKLVSKLGARRLMLELTGKLRDPGDGLRDLAQILADKWKGDDADRPKKA